MRDETRAYIRQFSIDKRIQSNISNMRDVLSLVDVCGEANDAETRDKLAFVLRALDLIESKNEEMLEVYARNFESMFTPEETRAIIKYAVNIQALEESLLDDLRTIFKPLLKAHRLDKNQGNRIVEVESQEELERELNEALDRTLALFGKRTHNYNA